MSLKNKVTPLVFRLIISNAFYSFKIEANSHRDVLAALEQPWDAFFPGNPIDYFFLDSFFNKPYEKDNLFGQVFGLFSLLAIFVASLGLFALASFLTIQRTKENRAPQSARILGLGHCADFIQGFYPVGIDRQPHRLAPGLVADGQLAGVLSLSYRDQLMAVPGGWHRGNRSGFPFGGFPNPQGRSGQSYGDFEG